MSRICFPIPVVFFLPQLEVNGHSVDENTTSTDQTFLMHMMDLNEALDDIETEEDLKGFLPGVQGE